MLTSMINMHQEAAAAVAMPTRTLSSASFVSSRFMPDIRRRHRVMTSFPPDPEARTASRGRPCGGVTSLSCNDFRLSIDNWASLATSHVTNRCETSIPTEWRHSQYCYIESLMLTLVGAKQWTFHYNFHHFQYFTDWFRYLKEYVPRSINDRYVGTQWLDCCIRKKVSRIN